MVLDFEENPWVDGNVMLRWLQKQRLLSVDLAGCPQMSLLRHSMPRMLVLDVPCAQKTPAVKDCMRWLHTLAVMVLPGCTLLVQPLDVCINKPLKDRIYNLAEQHYKKHLNEWTQNRYTPSQRQVLMTQWVGEAWTTLHLELQDTICRSFKKCGITVAIHGSEDSTEINIRGLDNYHVPSASSPESLVDLLQLDAALSSYTYNNTQANNLPVSSASSTTDSDSDSSGFDSDSEDKKASIPTAPAPLSNTEEQNPNPTCKAGNTPEQKFRVILWEEIL